MTLLSEWHRYLRENKRLLLIPLVVFVLVLVLITVLVSGAAPLAGFIYS